MCGQPPGVRGWRGEVDRAHVPPDLNFLKHCGGAKLKARGPKEALEFTDYTFEEHFGRIIPSFPPREVLCDYIKGRVDKANVRQYIQFNTSVRSVDFDVATDKFTVVTINNETKTDSTEIFDFVVCATGHFSTPNVPYFEGFNHFEGRILHAHDFRDAREMTDKDILVIGTSYSAEDIASQCYKYGVKSVTCSYRTAPMGFHWPDNFTTVPLLEKCVGKTCHFKDGSTKDIDAIILCTGYQHYFPFMSEELRLATNNRLAPNMLHKGMFFNRNPKLMYLGMMDQWYTFNMFDAQAWYCRDAIMGKVQLPPKGELDAELAAWQAKEDAMNADENSTYVEQIEFQADYVSSLIEATDYPHLDTKGVNEQFFEWEHNKHENVMTFRDHPHRSVLTGNMATVHHTPWLKALDDSMTCYLADKPLEEEKAKY